MWNRLASSYLVFPLLLAGVIASTALAFSASNRLLLPLLNIAFSYPVLFSLLAQAKRKVAVATMLFWALCMGVVMVFATTHFPDRASASIIHGNAYKEEMFLWISTGEGAEGNPLKFIPQHLLHLVIFTVLSFLTASTLSLLLGAVLMNYMSFYVGSLILTAKDPVLASWMGWHPWSILRVASFVMLGVLLAEPAVCRLVHRDYDFAGVRPILWTAMGGLMLDILLKASLAPWWGMTLRSILSH